MSMRPTDRNQPTNGSRPTDGSRQRTADRLTALKNTTESVMQEYRRYLISVPSDGVAALCDEFITDICRQPSPTERTLLFAGLSAACYSVATAPNDGNGSHGTTDSLSTARRREAVTAVFWQCDRHAWKWTGGYDYLISTCLGLPMAGIRKDMEQLAGLYGVECPNSSK